MKKLFINRREADGSGWVSFRSGLSARHPKWRIKAIEDANYDFDKLKKSDRDFITAGIRGERAKTYEGRVIIVGGLGGFCHLVAKKNDPDVKEARRRKKQIIDGDHYADLVRAGKA